MQVYIYTTTAHHLEATPNKFSTGHEAEQYLTNMYTYVYEFT